MKAVAVIVVLCIAVTQCQQTQSPQLQQLMTQIQQTVEQLFTRADLNHNGIFDLQDLANVFEEYDTNGDHKVSKTEFVTRMANNSAFMEPVARGLFIDLDMDKNGQLEASDTQLYFDKIDQNDDGRVSHQEFVNYFTQLFEVLIIVAIRAQQAAAGTN